MTYPWTPEDLRQMKAHGIAPAEAERQLELFRNPPPFLAIDRPATVGDGIRKLGPKLQKECLARYEKARRRGRFMKFVPASGAASRMFHLLLRFFQREPFTLEDLKAEVLRGEKETGEFLRFMEEISRTAFFDELGETLSRSRLDLETLRREGRYQEILGALLLPEGLGYSRKPKGLVKFHSYSNGSRTALEEHLVEAVQYVKDRSRTCRIHFTVSEEHAEASRDYFMAVREKYEKKYGVDFDIDFSTQSPKTDTLAVDPGNKPFRDKEDRLVFRPSGHGALLDNLNRLHGDLVYIKNIDNVVLEKKLEATVRWKKILGGYLASVQGEVFKHLKKLSGRPGAGTIGAAVRFAREELALSLGLDFEGLTAAQKIKKLRQGLDRPVRVCGVVANTGEPGGGPFWVKGPDGKVSLQIVESAQVNMGDPGQKDLFARSTHFNPVDLVCGVRDRNGKPFHLKRFRDPHAVFISNKSSEGKPLKALELPGLWNGAMAGWITLFVEVPLETFNPVKTVFDLLKPAHRI